MKLVVGDRHDLTRRVADLRTFSIGGICRGSYYTLDSDVQRS